MSVLMCPVCRGVMREVVHLGVTIDTCTKCRGVWLDRGELEKIAATLTDQQGRSGYSQASYRDADRRGDDDDDDDGDRHRRGGDPQQKRGMGRFLDFFD